MRIAICLSGGLRTFKIAAPLMMKSFVQPLKKRGHEIDFYFYGLSNIDGIEKNKEDIKQIYNPKKWLIKDWDLTAETEVLRTFSKSQLEFINSKKRPESNIIANLSQMYNIKKVFELMEEYECEHNFTYDLAIRSRVDYYYYRSLTDIQISEAYKVNNILIPNTWDFKQVRQYAMSDSFAVGRSEEMKRYSKIYDYIHQLVVKTNLFHVE